ncbi:MAG: hypothetical protein LAO79_00745 [Acidobacteriia bacterium]|nr:hypothetical protein [Terriglobia bacterium]
MRSFRDIPIRQKLIVTMVVTTAVALLLSGAGIIVLDSVYYRTHLRADLSAQAQIIAENSTAAVAFADASAAREMLGALRARPHVIMACIVMLDGTPLARYARPGADRSCPAAPPGDEIRFTRDTLIVTRPIVLKDRVLGTLVLLYDLE